MLIDYPKGTQDSTIVAGKGPKKKKKSRRFQIVERWRCRQLIIIQSRRKPWNEMSYKLSFEPPETWVCLFQEMLAFTFLPEIISHSTFIASSITDLCIGGRGTLIKFYSCHWNQNHNSSFPIPLPDSKNEMTLVPLRFGLCRRTKSPNMGLYFNSTLADSLLQIVPSDVISLSPSQSHYGLLPPLHASEPCTGWR